MFLGHCFLRGITQSGVRLGAVPTVQPGSLMLGLRSPFPSMLCVTAVAKPPLPVLGSPKGDVFLRFPMLKPQFPRASNWGCSFSSWVLVPL